MARWATSLPLTNDRLPDTGECPGYHGHSNFYSFQPLSNHQNTIESFIFILEIDLCLAFVYSDIIYISEKKYRSCQDSNLESSDP